MDTLDDVIQEMQWWMRIKPDLPSVCGRAIEVMKAHSKKGHWKGDDFGYKCSICGFCMCEMAHSTDYVTYEKTNFCPNCGADMREDGEQE